MLLAAVSLPGTGKKQKSLLCLPQHGSARSMENASKRLKDTVVSQDKSKGREIKKEQEKICTGRHTEERKDDYLGKGFTEIKQCCSCLP